MDRHPQKEVKVTNGAVEPDVDIINGRDIIIHGREIIINFRSSIYFNVCSKKEIQ